MGWRVARLVVLEAGDGLEGQRQRSTWGAREGFSKGRQVSVTEVRRGRVVEEVDKPRLDEGHRGRGGVGWASEKGKEESK